MIGMALLGLAEILVMITTGLVFWYGREGIQRVLDNKAKVLICIILSYIFLTFKIWLNILIITVFLLLLLIFLMFKFIWKLPLKGAIYCSLLAMTFITVSDAIGASLMYVFDSNPLNNTVAIIISKLMQALPIVFIVKYGIAMKNPLLIIKWKDLSNTLKFNVIISLLCAITSVALGLLCLISLTEAREVSLLNQSYYIISIVLAVITGYILFALDSVKEVNSLILLKSTLYTLNKTSNIDYYIDERLYSNKNFSYGPFVNLINILKKYRGLNCNFFYTYESLVVCFHFELNPKKSFLDDSEFKHAKLKMDAEYDFKEVYSNNQVQIQIRERGDLCAY